jgi:hypothetical protein
MRRGWPASEPSPKKLASLNMPIVASLPGMEPALHYYPTMGVAKLDGEGEKWLTFEELDKHNWGRGAQFDKLTAQA